MKRTISIASMCWLALAAFAGGGELKSGDIVAICGDSITEQRQYTALIEVYLIACQPAERLRAINFGWSGETAQLFNRRVVNDVVRFAPTVATLCYGMNDGGYGKLNPQRAELFRGQTREIVKKLKDGGVRFLIVGSPGCVDADAYQRPDAKTYNETLAAFRDIAREIAAEEQVAFADVHTLMIEVMTKAKAKFGAAYVLAGADGVHPDYSGQMVMAYAFLKALVGQHEIGTITVDLAANRAEATKGHTVKSMKNGVIELESTRYPFCFFGAPDSAGGTRSVAEFLPFNDDLNRFLLVVTNAAPRCNVTWGGATKAFNSARLAQGINLSEEFIDNNPFLLSFMKLIEGAQANQAYTALTMKEFITRIPIVKANATEAADCLEHVAEAMKKRNKSYADQLAGQLAPVRHILRIEEI